jgi:signal transduction histidine kinase
MAGFAATIAVLVIGMVVGIHQLNAAARAHDAQLSAEQQELSVAADLRWRADLVGSAARGYLESRDLALLAEWRDAAAGLGRAFQAFQDRVPTNEPASLEAAVARGVSEILREQAELELAVVRGQDLGELSERFSTELDPLRRVLATNLDAWIHRQAAAFGAILQAANQDRTRLTRQIHVALVMLALASIVIAWVSSRQLSRSYREQAAAHDAARQAVAARDELLGVVAHDLRNPLAAIMMKAALIRESREVAKSERMRAHAVSIENVAMRMDYLIKTMLDAASIETGHFSIEPAACEAAGVIREVADMFEGLSQSKHVRLDWSVTPNELVVRADRDRLIEVLTNLVGNALKFTAPGGVVRLAVDQRGDQARFAVVDTGPGIPSAEHERIFDRFWRWGTDGHKGTGLGLFIAKQVIEAHGGRIWVESESGHGATFHFTLAVGAPERADRPAHGAGVPVPA